MPEDKINTAAKLLKCYSLISKNDSSKNTCITIRAANLSLSDILGHWGSPNAYVATNFNEIRFLCTECFYIDTSLDLNSKNIAIVAPKVFVKKCLFSSKYHINLSGRDGKSFNSSCAHHGKNTISKGPGASGENG